MRLLCNLVCLVREVFQLHSEVCELVLCLLVYHSLDNLLLHLGLSATSSVGLAELFDAEVLFRDEFGLGLHLCSSLRGVDLLSCLGLLCRPSVVDARLDLVVELLALVVDVLDVTHVLIQAILDIDEVLDRGLLGLLLQILGDIL